MAYEIAGFRRNVNMCHHYSCGRQKACTRNRRPAQGLMGTQARSVHLAGHTATREHNLYHQILCSVYHMFPSMLVIVLLRYSTMAWVPCHGQRGDQNKGFSCAKPRK